MRRAKSVALGVLFSSVLLASGCRTPVSRVAVIPRTTGTLLWEPMHVGIAETAHRIGVHMEWNAPTDETDTEKQVSLIAASLRGGCKGLILAPDETLASRSIVLQAIGDHIPVVVVNDELGPPAGPMLSYVENDEMAGARLAASELVALLHGRGSIAVMGISPRLDSGLARDEDLELALKSMAPEIRIVERRFGDSVITHQQQIAQQLLDRSEPIDAIVALTATATRGAYYAKVARDSRTAVHLVGFDQDLLVPVQTGDVDAVVAQDTLTIGRIAMENLAVEMRGGNVAGRTPVAPMLITRQNVASSAALPLWSFADYPWSEQ